jgi:hypothetical protein
MSEERKPVEVVSFLERFKSKRAGDAATPKQQRRKTREPFALVPLAWAIKAAEATRSPETLVLIEIIFLAWKAKGEPFPLPSARLRGLGVSQKIKRRVLRDLERAGLIAVERPPRCAPVVTLIGLAKS